MAIQTGSTYISKSMTDIIKIPTANLWPDLDFRAFERYVFGTVGNEANIIA